MLPIVSLSILAGTKMIVAESEWGVKGNVGGRNVTCLPYVALTKKGQDQDPFLISKTLEPSVHYPCISARNQPEPLTSLTQRRILMRQQQFSCLCP